MSEEMTQATSMNDLRPKMCLEGIVTRTELYGAFVNLGLEREGLVHISRLAPKRVNKVTDKVKVGDKVMVWVTNVDADQGRIGLTMVEPPAVDWDELNEGQIVTGTVKRLERYGAFIDVGAERLGLLHVSAMGRYVREPSEVVKENEVLEVRILRLDRRKRQIDFTMDLGDEPEVEEEVSEEPLLSAMEMAYRQAQKVNTRKKTHGEKMRAKQRFDYDDEMEDIYRRTLSD